MAQFYTLEEAARVLGMSPDELKQQAQGRKVRAFMDSGSWRFRVADIDEMARLRGMGSDPDLSLSDLDLDVQPESMSGSEDIMLSEFQLGVASPDAGNVSSVSVSAGHDAEGDILFDDIKLAPDLTGSSSTIIGMKGVAKLPTDSDVQVVPQTVKGASDSDVRLAGKPVGLPGDSEVTLFAGDPGTSADHDASDPGATTLRQSPLLGSSDEVRALGDDSASDFELTPSSVIDALEPESGSDFELTALDQSDEFESTPLRGPGDSDVTGAEPSASGINLGRPSDSGINLQSVGGFNLDSMESIGLEPLEEDDQPKGKPKPKPKPAAKPAPKPAMDPGATALPSKVDLSATALPMKADKDIFEDTDFEVDALDSGGDDRTVQLEANSDFDLEEDDSVSKVFAVDEDDVDQAAATAMGPAVLDDDDAFDSSDDISGETDEPRELATKLLSHPEAPKHKLRNVAEDDEEEKPEAAAPRGRGAVRSAPVADAPWGGGTFSLVAGATVLTLLIAFLAMDLAWNFGGKNETAPTFGLVKQLAGMFGF